MLERVDRLLHARVLGDHMSRPLGQRRRQLRGHLERRLAERRNPHLLGCLRALGSALVIAGVGDRVAFAGVEGHELVAAELERDALDVERAEVDPQRTVLLAI